MKYIKFFLRKIKKLVQSLLLIFLPFLIVLIPVGIMALIEFFSSGAEVNGINVAKAFDYKLSEETTYGNETLVSEIKLPKSNVLKYILEDDSWFVVRPSGTEPKMKIYLSVVGDSLKDSEEKLINFKKSVMDKINNILG